MLNKLKAFMDCFRGENVVCAVSGGADSMALLWGLYLLRDKLEITLSAAHFNHGLRGGESDLDEAFVRDFCEGYKIPFTSATARVTAGEKGLEAAARDARYAFLKTLSGRVATAHTADDNAETVLMHLIRGTGLKGLGGIAPVNGKLIRPMLDITRGEVLAFLAEYSIPYREDSSNAGDDFLRNRLRHHVMPLLKQENPSLSRNVSAMALRLRQDEKALEDAAQTHYTNQVPKLRHMTQAIRSRVLARMLTDAGVKEPEASHIQGMESLIFSEKPSARADFPGGVTVCRRYDVLEVSQGEQSFQTRALTCPGETVLPDLGLRIVCKSNAPEKITETSFPVIPKGKILVRSKTAGDSIRLSGGTKTLKKLFIDRKIPAASRGLVPVLADDEGVLGVVGIGGNFDRFSDSPDAVRICIENL